MSTDYEMRMLTPFSPSIIKASMPADMVAALNDRTDAIMQELGGSVARHWSEHLVGKVSREVSNVLPVFFIQPE